MILGVLSDTHIHHKAKKLPKEILTAFRRVDHILHAGDILNLQVLEELRNLAPVHAVAGNVDPPGIHKILGRKKVLSFSGFSIGLIHGDGPGGSTPDRAFKAFQNEKVDCIVFGHSHIPYIEERDGILLFNPGSPTDRRWQPRFSYGILKLNDKIHPRIEFFL